MDAGRGRKKDSLLPTTQAAFRVGVKTHIPEKLHALKRALRAAAAAAARVGQSCFSVTRVADNVLYVATTNVYLVSKYFWSIGVASISPGANDAVQKLDAAFERAKVKTFAGAKGEDLPEVTAQREADMQAATDAYENEVVVLSELYAERVLLNDMLDSIYGATRAPNLTNLEGQAGAEGWAAIEPLLPEFLKAAVPGTEKTLRQLYSKPWGLGSIDKCLARRDQIGLLRLAFQAFEDGLLVCE
jgi:hypothetical protein